MVLDEYKTDEYDYIERHGKGRYVERSGED
jgi:hypothetical protein